MNIRRLGPSLAGVAALPALALVAACGSNPTPATNAAAPAPSATLNVANTGNLGNVLVNSQGRTLYLFQADTGTTSNCTGACAAAWPPLVSNGKPTTGNGVNAGMVGTTMRSDGTTQVTYNGHPLYTYIRDSKPGDANGQGVTAFGGAWFAVSPSGSAVTSSSSSSGGGSSGGGLGY